MEVTKVTKVEFVPMPIIKRVAVRSRIYETEQDSGFERVIVDGVQWGLVPNNSDDPNYRVLHPLSMGLPQELLMEVVRKSNGRLTSTLRGPIPHVVEEDEEPYEDEDE